MKEDREDIVHCIEVGLCGNTCKECIGIIICRTCLELQRGQEI